MSTENDLNLDTPFVKLIEKRFHDMAIPKTEVNAAMKRWGIPCHH